MRGCHHGSRIGLHFNHYWLPATVFVAPNLQHRVDEAHQRFQVNHDALDLLQIQVLAQWCGHIVIQAQAQPQKKYQSHKQLM
jgi:hypothetical protein